MIHSVLSGCREDDWLGNLFGAAHDVCLSALRVRLRAVLGVLYELEKNFTPGGSHAQVRVGIDAEHLSDGESPINEHWADVTGSGDAPIRE
jgi:hypothetical protein